MKKELKLLYITRNKVHAKKLAGLVNKMGK